MRHSVLMCNETLKRGGKLNQDGNAQMKESRLQRADPLRVMTQKAMGA